MKNLSTSWAEVLLGQICEFKYGKSLPELKRTGGNIPVFGSNGIIGQHNEAITDGSTIVIGRKGSLGEVNFSNVSCWPIDTTYYIDKSATDTDLKWLAYQLSGLGLTKLNKAAAVPGLNREDAYRQRLLLPPLEDQRRIAEILDRAEELRSKRREAIAQLDTLTQAIFLEMFGDPAFNPQKWPRIQLVDLCSSGDEIKCGPFGTQLGKDEYTTEGVPLWGIRNVNALFKILTHEFLEARTAKRLMQYSIEPGDIVMTRKGTVGNCAVYPDSYPLGIMHSDLLRLRVSRQKCVPIFLSHQLHYSRDVERQLALISGGAIMPGINVTKLKSLEVLVPPLSLQQEFAHRVEAVEKLKTAHYSSLSELDALFASLQHRAFQGEL